MSVPLEFHQAWFTSGLGYDLQIGLVVIFDKEMWCGPVGAFIDLYKMQKCRGFRLRGDNKTLADVLLTSSPPSFPLFAPPSPPFPLRTGDREEKEDREKRVGKIKNVLLMLLIRIEKIIQNMQNQSWKSQQLQSRHLKSWIGLCSQPELDSVSH